MRVTTAKVPFDQDGGEKTPKGDRETDVNFWVTIKKDTAMAPSAACVTRSDVLDRIFRQSRPTPLSDRDERYPLDVAVEAYRLDEELVATGSLIQLQARDVGAEGIGLFAPHNIAEDFLLLKIPADAESVVVPVRIIWEEKISTESHYRFGAEFMDDSIKLSWPETTQN